MENKSFVDKVYDAYIKEDYSYGDNNLNPKREIKKMSLKNTNDQLNKILASIQRKVTEISIKYPDTTYKVDDAIGNFGGDGKVNSLPTSVREAINRSGGSGNTVVMIPSMDGDTSPLMGQVEMTIAKILATMASSDNNGDSDSSSLDDFGTSGMDLFDISCNGTINIITGGENTDTDDYDVDSDDDGFGNDSDDNSDNDEDDDGNGGKDSDSNGSTTGDDDAGNGTDNLETTNSDDETADAAMEKAVNEALARIDSDIATQNANAKQCAIKDLGLMKAFLAILKVIQTIKKAMNPLMNILMDVTRIVVLAAGCWNNPTNVSEIVQRIAVKLVAILIMVVAMLVQMFWEMLGLDCITQEAKSVIDQIKEALTGVASTYNKVERTAIQFGANVEKAKDAFEEAKSAIDEVLENLSTDSLKEKFNLDGVAEDIYKNGLGGKAGLKNSALGGLQSTGAYDDIMSTIESVKSLKTTADKTIDSIMKSKGGQAANATVRKISTQLHNVQAK